MSVRRDAAYGVPVSREARARMVSEFCGWAARSHPDVKIEPDAVETLLEFKETYLDSADPAVWRRGEMSALLAEIVPRKVFADRQWSLAMADTVPVFVEFLGSEKHVSGAQWLRNEASAALPVFLAAADDPGAWGFGKRVLAGMGAEGISDSGAIEDVISRFNELPFEERDRILGPLPDPQVPTEPPAPLPAVRLASIPELVEAARASSFMADLVAVARWLGERREVTATGALRVKDGRRAAVDLGLITARELARRELIYPIRSSAEIVGLDELWRWAVESDFVELSATRAYPGQALVEWDAGDESALDAWVGVFDAVVAGLADGALARLPYVPRVHAEILPVLFAAYVEGEVSRELVVEGLVEELGDHPLFQLASIDAATKLGEALDGGLDRLARLGALIQDGDAVRLTPLGVWRLNALYASFGWEAPSVGDLRNADVLTRLDGIAQLTMDDADAEMTAWLEETEPGALAGDLVEAMGKVECTTRGLVFELLDRIGDPAASAVDRLFDTELWRYAATWYLARDQAGPRPMDARDAAWMFVEQLSGLVDTVADDDDALRAALPEDGDIMSPDTFDLMRRSGHPRAGDVLDMVSRTATDKKTAKAARKAAFQARSR